MFHVKRACPHELSQSGRLGLGRAIAVGFGRPGTTMPTNYRMLGCLRFSPFDGRRRFAVRIYRPGFLMGGRDDNCRRCRFSVSNGNGPAGALTMPAGRVKDALAPEPDGTLVGGNSIETPSRGCASEG